MAQNDIYKASAIFSHALATGDLVMTFHYRLDDISTGLSEIGYCNELASQLRSILETHYLPLISSGYTFDRVDVYNITQPSYQGTYPSGDPGSVAGDVLPIRAAVVAARKSGLRGRRYNGRLFLLAPLETQNVAGQIDSTFKNALYTMLNTYVSQLTTGNGNDYQGVIWSGTYSVASDIATYIVRDILGSQRGRQETS